MVVGRRPRRGHELDRRSSRSSSRSCCASRRTPASAPSRLMMPLSVAALISGMMTLVATAPNLVVNARAASATGRGLPVLQLHAVRPAGAGPGHRLHAVRAPLAGRDRPRRRRHGAGRACATGSRSTGSPTASIACASTARLAAGRQDARGAAAARHVRREHLLAIERGGRFAHRDRPPDGADRAAGRRRPARSTCSRPTSISRRCGASWRWSCCRCSGRRYFTDRSQEIGMVEVIAARRTRSWSARRVRRGRVPHATTV